MRDPHERELEEVERALSVLGGHHPEQVRAEREAAQAAARRQDEHRAAREQAQRRSRKRLIASVLVVAVVGAGGGLAYRAYAARAAMDAEIAPLVARYVALGFDVLPRGTFAPEPRVEMSTTAGDCYAFVATRAAQMRIERPIGVAGAKGEALVCTCASEAIVVATDGAPVRALHISGAALGGPRALAYRFTESAPTIVAGDDACEGDMLAAFARDKHYPAQGANGEWLVAHPSLTSDGFTTNVTTPPRWPFAFVDGASHCFIAVAAVGDELTVWALGESMQKVLHDQGALAWCAVKQASFIVERSGKGALTIASAASLRLGGVIGLRESLARASLTMPTWSRDDERSELARDTLRASVVPEPVAISSQTLEATEAKTARVLVFSSSGETFTTNDLDFRCAGDAPAHDMICVQPHALTWRPPAPSVACGGAYGPLPYWMSVLDDVHDPRVLDVELALLRFSRRLNALGFIPSVIEGVTERVDSVDILGRSGDDAIVAVGLWPVPPFVLPYTDGAAWKLDGDPHVISLASGMRVSLPVQATQARPSPHDRRTVVFRHTATR